MSTARPVALLTNAVAPDQLGGLERYVRELAAGLVEAGHPVTVIAKRTSPHQAAEEVGEDGVRVLRHAAPNKRDPLFAVKYAQTVVRASDSALAALGPETVLHAHFVVPALAPLLRRRPFVYTFHAPVYRELLHERQGTYRLPAVVQRPAVAGLRSAERWVLRRARAVVALSEFSRGEIRTLSAAVAEDALVIPGGIDTTRFMPADRGPDSTPPPRGMPLLVAARRFTTRTGLLELVQAMPAILRALPGAHLVLLGDGRARNRVEGEIASLGLGSAISLLGRVTDKELLAWYQAADLVVMPTQELEGFGLTTAEAMSCGTPVVATPVGANPEVVGPLGPDFLMGGIAPDEMAVGILRAAARVGVSPLAAAQVRAAVHPRLSWGAVVERHIALYATVGRAAGSN